MLKFITPAGRRSRSCYSGAVSDDVVMRSDSVTKKKKPPGSFVNNEVNSSGWEDEQVRPRQEEEKVQLEDRCDKKYINYQHTDVAYVITVFSLQTQNTFHNLWFKFMTAACIYSSICNFKAAGTRCVWPPGESRNLFSRRSRKLLICIFSTTQLVYIFPPFPSCQKWWYVTLTL